MVYAGDEAQQRGLEGVFGGQGEDEAVAAGVEGRFGGGGVGYMPGVEVGVVGEGEGQVGRGGFGAFGVFLFEGWF